MFTSMELTKVLFVFAENFRKRCLMGFKDRLREKRVEANLTQAALAEKVSVTARTIQNYELGSRKPTKYEVVKKIAEALNTTPEYLLGNSGMLVLAAQEQGGAKAAREIDELVSEVSGMFAGAVSVKTRWTARCRLSPEPTGLQKKRTRSTRRKVPERTDGRVSPVLVQAV